MYCKHHLFKHTNRVIRNSRRHIEHSNSGCYVFDKNAKQLQRERAILDPESKLYDYLREEVSFRLYDNLFDVKRRFSRIAEFGCGKGHFSQHLTTEVTDEVMMCDSSLIVLENSYSPHDGVKCVKRVMDEEDLSFESNSLDLIVNCLSLHWTNNLPGAFQRVITALKNDGAFLASMYGGETLYELRSSLQLADTERWGGITPHISPFTAVRDVGDLLTRAGFTLLTIDTDEITVGYPSIFELMWDLKGMGENNAAINRCSHMNKDSLLAAAAIYENMYGEEGKIPATFQLINFIAWKPDPSQPKPLTRGSGEIPMQDIDKLNEIIKEKGFIDLNEEEKKK